jgi:hypothetical protein
MVKQNTQFDQSDESVKEKMSEKMMKEISKEVDEQIQYFLYFTAKMVNNAKKTVVDESTEDHAFRLGSIDAYNHVMSVLRQNLSENIMKEALNPCGCEDSL